MGQDPDAADNRWRDAFENRVAIIYFLGIAPGRYEAILPGFVSGWDPIALKARGAFGEPDSETLVPPDDPPARLFALRAVKQRLHQAALREAVFAAYSGRCAITGLPKPLLLDAAHIVADKDERLGHPIVPNGVSRKFTMPRSRTLAWHRSRVSDSCLQETARPKGRADA